MKRLACMFLSIVSSAVLAVETVDGYDHCTTGDYGIIRVDDTALTNVPVAVTFSDGIDGSSSTISISNLVKTATLEISAW